MVLDVSYSRVLVSDPRSIVLWFFYEKQAIRRRQFAAIDCDVFMCGSYRITSSELPRGLMCRCFPNKVVTRHSADKPWVTDGFRALVKNMEGILQGTDE